MPPRPKSLPSVDDVIALSSPTTDGSSTYSKCGEHTISLVKTDQPPSSSKTHASLSPKINLLLICVWAIFVVFAFWIIQPRLPFSLAIAGGFLGVLAGVMQHLSISHDPNEFVAASSLMGGPTSLNEHAMGPQIYCVALFQQGRSDTNCVPTH